MSKTDLITAICKLSQAAYLAGLVGARGTIKEHEYALSALIKLVEKIYEDS